MLQNVLLTLATKVSISSSAKRRPTHILGPNPKGKETKGCVVLVSGMCPSEVLIHLSGIYSLACEKYFSCLLRYVFAMSTDVCYQKVQMLINHLKTEICLNFVYMYIYICICVCVCVT